MQGHLPSLLAALSTEATFVIVGCIVVGGLVFLAVFARYLGLWLQCKTTGAGISLANLVMMSIRKVSPSLIVRSKIMAVQSGVTQAYPISTRALEAHFLAGGDVQKVIQALVAAYRAQINLDWQTAQAIDLAGRDILDAVRTCVYPKVIDCPDPKKTQAPLDAVSQDGIQLRVKARVTVRSDMQRLIGGATEETIIARVGQAIVQAIGSMPSYKDCLENPERISQTALNQGLEAHTAFEIVSIDIADIDVGVNIGAKLQAEQAEADMRIAQAHAEEHRALFTAVEQEMIALVQENRAAVVLAEAEVPQGIASSFRDGKIGLLDYWKLKNTDADTQMRLAISGTDSGDRRG